MNRLSALLCLACLSHLPTPAQAWGDEGHEVVALIAEHYLQPAVKDKVFALLAADTGTLTAHDLASEATWADRFRDSDRNTTKVDYNRTRNWHFVDTEIAAPDFDAACFKHPPLPPGTPASQGAAQECAADKIVQFAAELAAPATSAKERLMALQFVLHFVGDLHQPLHASDDHDSGGNAKLAKTASRPQGTLHHYWDTEFVTPLGPSAAAIAAKLIAGITPADKAAWKTGTPAAWAMETFAVARDTAYGALPKPTDGVYELGTAYQQKAEAAVALQLQKAGVRLAATLNHALAP
jgi:hypothetical protein